MKFKSIFVLVLGLLFCLTLFACDNGSKSVESIKVVESTIPGEISVYNFKLDSLKIEVKYANGKIEEIKVEAYMLSAGDNDKLSKIGYHEITINYLGKSTKFNIILKEGIDNIVDPQGSSCDIIFYSTTTITAQGINSKLSVLGKNEGFSSFLIRIAFDESQVAIISVTKNIAIEGLLEYNIGEGYIDITFTKDSNIISDVYLLDILFTGSKMYDNFANDDVFVNEYNRINSSNEVVSFSSVEYLFKR